MNQGEIMQDLILRAFLVELNPKILTALVIALRFNKEELINGIKLLESDLDDVVPNISKDDLDKYILNRISVLEGT